MSLSGVLVIWLGLFAVVLIGALVYVRRGRYF